MSDKVETSVGAASEPKVRCSAWLCRVVGHRWREIGYNSVLNPLPVERCDRCGIGQQWNIAGFCIRYTKAAMDAEMKRHNAEVSDGGPLTHESTETRTRRSLH